MKKLDHHEGYFRSHDHHRLYYQRWQAADKSSKKPVLIFVHGVNEHSGRYQNPVSYFAPQGFAVYVFDHRGHGRSDGLRSFVEDFDHYMKDLDEFVSHVMSEQKDRPVFMIGHSLGGQIVLNYISLFKHGLAGAIVSSPNVKIAIKVPPLKKWLAMKLATFAPTIALANELDPKWICRDTEVVRNYKRDPLVSKKTTLKLITEMFKNQERILGLAKRIKVPLFVMHAGDDHITSPDASREFYELVPGKNKKLKIYEGFYHELFNEIGKEEVFKDMQAWIEEH